MTPRPTALTALAVGGVLAVVSASQPWWSARGEGVTVTFDGSEVTGGLAQALAVVVLTGVVLILALRVRGRRLVATALALVAAGIILTGLRRQRPSPEAVLNQAREVSLADQFALDPTLWPWLYAGAGLAALAGAMLVVLTAARWPSRVARFERTETAPVAVSADADASDVWKAMDAGLDPTAPEVTARPDLDVHPGQQGDRMGDAAEAQHLSTRSSPQVE